MAGSAFRRMFGGEPEPQPNIVGSAELTSAYLDADRLFTAADADVRTAAALDGRSSVVRAWRSVTDRYAAATDRYLWASGTHSGERPPGAHDVAGATRELTDLVATIERFQRDHGAELTQARGASARVAAAVQAARTAAETTTNRLASAQSAPYLGLRPVIAATDRLALTVRELDAAHNISAQDSAATEVIDAAAALNARLDEAPNLTATADRSIASADTRLQAVRNRSHDLSVTRSALLREFSAACSADLVDNDQLAAKEADAAGSDLASARGYLRNNTPDLALDAIKSAREHLDTADSAVNAVTERLRLMRQVKADPAAYAARTRFSLRDAQLLAVDKRQVREWGSVLDAQNERIDRAVSNLDRVHPDYWNYVTTLADVDATIDRAVNRMRGRT